MAHRRFSPVLLAEIAQRWKEEGKTEPALRLLEPMFTHPRFLDERHVEALSVLMDLYTDLGQVIKRLQLHTVCLAAADPILRSAAQQDLATMLYDAGDTAAAWAAWQDALRDNPSDPQIALIELVFLQSEDKMEQMRERARFWASRFAQRLDADEFKGAIAVLEDIIHDPEGYALRIVSKSSPLLGKLVRILADLPPVRYPPRIELLPNGEGYVVDNLPDTLYEQWSEVIQQADVERIGAWLEAHAEVWDDPMILNDIALTLSEPQPTPYVNRRIYTPFYDRVRALADTALAPLTSRPRLPWQHLANHPLLQLLLARAQWLAHQGRLDEAIDAGEELIALEPDDNLGTRETLATCYARTGCHTDLLALCERYPDEAPGTCYNRALALYALGRMEEAETALSDAVRSSAKHLQWLLADSVLDPDSETASDHEAWAYCEANQESWRRSGALEWARMKAPAIEARG